MINSLTDVLERNFSGVQFPLSLVMYHAASPVQISAWANELITLIENRLLIPVEVSEFGFVLYEYCASQAVTGGAA